MFKVFTVFVTILLPYYVFGFFSQQACGILAPQPTPTLGGEVLTTGPPGRSHQYSFLTFRITMFGVTGACGHAYSTNSGCFLWHSCEPGTWQVLCMYYLI